MATVASSAKARDGEGERWHMAAAPERNLKASRQRAAGASAGASAVTGRADVLKDLICDAADVKGAGCTCFPAAA